MRGFWRILAGIALTTLFGCGDGSVNACFGDAAFCHIAFNPVARPGPNQTVASGDVVTLDGSNSTPSGGIRSYSWAQTGGPAVTLTDATSARATFVAPAVATSADLSFRLTVVNNANQADSSSTQVTVQPPAAAAVTAALALFESSLQPGLAVAPENGCPSATADLSPDLAAAQRGLWFAARSIAIAKGIDAEDSSAFFDASRVLVATSDAAIGVPAQIESFGMTLLGSLSQQFDPALREAVAVRLSGAAMLDDPAGLLSGSTEVTDANGVAIVSTPDSDAANAAAIGRLLASRSQCVDAVQAVSLTSAGLRVIAAASTDE